MKKQVYLTISVKEHHSCAIKTADDSQNGYIGIDWCESTEIYEASDSTIGLKNYTINFMGRGSFSDAQVTKFDQPCHQNMQILSTIQIIRSVKIVILMSNLSL